MKSTIRKKIDSFLLWVVTNRGIYWLLCGLTILVFVVNIGYCISKNGAGFPLDDAWIHQTYARSFARDGAWTYSLNEQSAGSTSPLWTLMLVPGFLLHSDNPFIWTYLVSFLCFLGLVCVCFRLFELQTPQKKTEGMIFGLLIVLEWHLVWASGSGMETLLFTLGIAFCFYLLRKKVNDYWIGLCIGLLVCIRPDGITLLGPALFILAINILQKKQRFHSFLLLLGGLVIPLLVYGYHNYSLSGAILPNTFFAKSAEYRELLSIPLITRYLNLFTVLLSGAGLLLLPGFLWSLFLVIRKRDSWGMSSILWVLGYILSYAVRLPVTYQHGRYLIPVIPIYFLTGYEGTLDIIERITQKKRTMYRRISLVSLVIISVTFLIPGISAFSTDVNTVNKLMVEPALWLRDHTSSDSIVAAHDIGAIGYYSERKIVDLAGLIDSNVVPIIRDEAELEAYILRSGADYVVVFSDWYQKIGSEGEIIAQFSYQKDSLVKTVQITQLFKPQ